MDLRKFSAAYHLVSISPTGNVPARGMLTGRKYQEEGSLGILLASTAVFSGAWQDTSAHPCTLRFSAVCPRLISRDCFSHLSVVAQYLGNSEFP